MEGDLPDLGPRKKLVKALAQKIIHETGISAAPVSLQRVIEHLQTTHDLGVEKINASSKVSGLLVVCREVDAEYATIAFNENHPWCRRRFTIAHEIGHFLLGHTCNNRQDDGSHAEREANMFAGELLVPTEFIKKDYKNIPNIQELSKLYRVSGQTLTIKLMDTKLI